MAAVPGIDDADNVRGTHLAAITRLSLSNKSITSLKSGDFNGLISLTHLNLNNNSISDISALEKLTSLTQLKITSNSFSDISSLERMKSADRPRAAEQFHQRYICPQRVGGTLTHLDLTNNSVSDISALEKLTKMSSLKLRNNSISDVSPLEKLTTPRFRLLWLRDNPILDYGPPP